MIFQLKFSFAACLAFLTLACASPPLQPLGQPGVRTIATAVARHDVVFLGEEHQNKEIHDFIAALIADERFLDAVDDIAIEFGNSLHQDLADRYVRGDDVTIEDLMPVWRDTTQWLVWDSPLYQAFFENVRAANMTRPKDEKIRVLLLDPPIDWSSVQSAADYHPYGERSQFGAQRLMTQSITRNRNVLVIIGGTHIMARQANNEFNPEQPNDLKSMAQHIRDARPGGVYGIYPLIGPGHLEALSLPESPDGTLFDSSHPHLAGQSFANARLNKSLMVQREVDGELVWVDVPNDSWPPAPDMVEALLFVSETATDVPQQKVIYQDLEYQAELRRRAKILEDEYGFEFEGDLDAILNQ